MSRRLVLSICLIAVTLIDAEICEGKSGRPAPRAVAAAVKPLAAGSKPTTHGNAVASIASKWLNTANVHHSSVGIEIMDVRTGKVLYSHNGNTRFNPASVLKIVTTACLLDAVGADFKYKTQIVLNGTVSNGHLNGDLVLVPSQDPSFSTENMHTLLASVAATVKVIEGSVGVSSVPGGGDHFAGAWLVEDYGQDWMPVSSDFVIDRNCVKAKDAGRGNPVMNVTAANDLDAVSRTLLLSPWAPGWVQFNAATNAVQVFMPKVPVQGSHIVANPTAYNQAYLQSMVRMFGIKIQRKQREAAAAVAYEHFSKPLPELLRYCLKESDNLYAQQFVRTLGALTPPTAEAPDASLEDRGLMHMNNWLVSLGIPYQTGTKAPQGVILYDGCGLSRKDYISPHALNVVLCHMAGPTGNGPFVDLLLHEGEAKTKTRAFNFKTGAMDSVRSVSGIVRTTRSTPLAVSVIVNGHTISVRDLRPQFNRLIHSLESLPI